eukprot:622403-Hanusia_phi.AAC.1
MKIQHTDNLLDERHVLWQQGHTFCVDGSGLRHREILRQVRLRRLLKRRHSVGLEAEIGLEILRDFPHKPDERDLAEEEISGLLVLSDLPKGDSA